MAGNSRFHEVIEIDLFPREGLRKVNCLSAEGLILAVNLEVKECPAKESQKTNVSELYILGRIDHNGVVGFFF